MNLVSIQFLGYIFCNVILYYCLPSGLRKYLLLAANFFFYYLFGIKNLLLFLILILLSYFFAKRMDHSQAKKPFLCIAVIAVILPLFFFKYFDFLVNRTLSLDISLPFSLVEPVGISFFTFKMISYLVESYRKTIKTKHSIIEYALYVSFWPTILSGPIDRPEEMIRQYSSRTAFDLENIRLGLARILYGYFQKMLLADNLSVIVEHVFRSYEKASSFALFLTSIFYTLQIYFDFAGYSNIACGIARMLGIRCMENFCQPYFSKSIQEFWRRWHISLSTWFRDYVYIPLGGKYHKLRNILIVFFLSGLWHGAAWNFVFWGVLHGVYQISGYLTIPFRKKYKNYLREKHPRLEQILSTAACFLMVNFAWIFFWCNNDIMRAFRIISGMFRGYGGITFSWILDTGMSFSGLLVLLFSILLAYIVDLLFYKGIPVFDEFLKMNTACRFLITYILLFTILLFGVYGPGYDASAFIYFQF